MYLFTYILIVSLWQPVMHLNLIYMEMKETFSYVAPAMSVIEVEVEKGFASSAEGWGVEGGNG